MYHAIAPTRDGADYFAVHRASFAAQLDRLAALDLRGVSIESALHPRTGASPRAGTVAISFDDGRSDNFSEAFPELAARGMAATFFVITSRVGTPGYATWDELRAMRDAGMSIQSHTHTHPFLSELSHSAARVELETSRRLLDSELGQVTSTIALPNGDSPRGWTRADFESVGFRWVATSEFGPNGRPSWRIRRYTIRRETTLADFERMVTRLPTTLSGEGLRLRVLGIARATLGVTRYARWRRRVLRLAGR
jgi:peptidoglycan/xylan/chitin deacetylase (PgdA/CDA1 family)